MFLTRARRSTSFSRFRLNIKRRRSSSSSSYLALFSSSRSLSSTSDISSNKPTPLLSVGSNILTRCLGTRSRARIWRMRSSLRSCSMRFSSSNFAHASAFSLVNCSLRRTFSSNTLACASRGAVCRTAFTSSTSVLHASRCASFSASAVNNMTSPSAFMASANSLFSIRRRSL